MLLVIGEVLIKTICTHTLPEKLKCKKPKNQALGKI